MGWVNTVFNGASARHNRRTAIAAAATSEAVGQMAAADRHRELRERGLITHRSTPAEIAAVEHRLAAQMRARRELAGDVDERHPYVEVAVAVVVVALLAGGVVGGLVGSGVGVLVGVFAGIGAGVVLSTVVRRRERERVATIARADWNARGVCRWCKSSGEHLVDGEPEHPRVAHAVEVEAAVGR